MQLGTTARTAPPRAATGAAVAVVLGCVAAVLVLPPDVAGPVVSNPAQTLAALAAAASGLHCARRSSGRRRRAWVLLGLACLSWGLGQAYWLGAVFAGVGVPFPSWSDAGFVGFDVLALLALGFAAGPGGRSRWQRAADALTTAATVGLLSWQSTLGAVFTASKGTDAFEATLLLAYPVFDVLLVVLVVLSTAGRPSGARASHLLVAAGLVALSVSDSWFSYLQATGSYEGGLVDLGWVAGFLLIALAGLTRGAAAAGPAEQAEPDGGWSRLALLPYVPVAVSLASTVGLTLAGRPLSNGELLTASVVISVLVGRQYLTLRDNARLTAELAQRELLLRHQALHDPLTGLANRLLFRDRLEHALSLHRRDRRPLALVFLDLDAFKAVNDTLGHVAGDELLRTVARRLTQVVREGDTVARLGGDEFAVLVEGCADPREVADRLAEVVAAPVVLREGADGGTVTVGASVGVCAVAAGDEPRDADEVLACSDTAMYAAKRAGGSRVATAGPSPVPSPSLPVA